MNFKKMAEEATARKEEETPNLDFEDMTDLRDDAISDFEMSFDREAELRGRERKESSRTSKLKSFTRPLYGKQRGIRRRWSNSIGRDTRRRRTAFKQ